MRPEVEHIFRVINEELDKIPEEKRNDIYAEFINIMWKTIVEATFGEEREQIVATVEPVEDDNCEQCMIEFDDSGDCDGDNIYINEKEDGDDDDPSGTEDRYNH